jgi:NADPH2:quinone reductase
MTLDGGPAAPHRAEARLSLSSEMPAAIVDRPGAEPRISRVPVPARAKGTTLIEVAAAPLNPLDLVVASGNFHSVRHEEPYTPGSECVGTVLGSDSYPVGTWVYAECHPAPASPGSFATSVVVADDDVLPLPDQRRAAGNSGTAAFIALIDDAALRAGQTVLILGATGAVGQLAVQIARRHGAGRVVGVGRDQAALAHLIDLGADAAVDLRPDEDEDEDEDRLADRFLAAAGPVDIVLDGLFGVPFQAALRACAPRAHVVNIGNLAGAIAQLPAGLLRGKQLTVSGFAGIHTPLCDKRAALDWLWASLARGDLRVGVRTFPLDELSSAWRAQASSPHAKCVVLPTTSYAHLQA